MKTDTLVTVDACLLAALLLAFAAWWAGRR